MRELKLSIIDKNRNTKVISSTGNSIITLVYSAHYEEGDTIALELDAPGNLCEIQLDDAMRPAVVFMKASVLYYKIPFDSARTTLSPKAFSGNRHIITVKLLSSEEFLTRKNLALNPYDGFIGPEVYPKSQANIETRGEAVFASRNAIDGIYANQSHGNFPYQSWGIDKREDAEWSLEFGRNVIVDEIRLTLRADFPHDNYWKSATVTFSNGYELELLLLKTADPQSFKFEPQTIKSLTLHNFIKSELTSPFPALTQFEVWGRDIIGEE